MRSFFRGRIAGLISIAGAAALVVQGPASAAVSTVAAPPLYSDDTESADPDEVARGDSDSASADRTNYNCEAKPTVEDTIASCDKVKDKDRGLVWKILLAVVIGAFLVYLVKRTSFSPDERPQDQALIEDGPQLPASYPDGSLSVRAFARDGWPVVVDFEPQPGTVTQLEVTIGGGNDAPKKTVVLDPDGSRGRQVVKVTMPDTGAARFPKPATYFISSLPIAALDVDQPKTVETAPLRIYGIGGGPRAVGSVAIEQLAFGRSTPGARFSYVARSEFSKARSQVQKLQREGNTIRIVPVFEKRQSNLSIGEQSGAWPGTVTGSSAPSRGVHRLQVTGWFTTDDRSWVAAIAPDLVVQ